VCGGYSNASNGIGGVRAVKVIRVKVEAGAVRHGVGKIAHLGAASQGFCPGSLHKSAQRILG
jgi:hypothetical protein